MKTLFLALLLASPFLRADDAVDEPAATVIELTGEAFYEAEGAEMKPVELGQLFAAGDRLQTRENSSLELVLADGSTLSLGPNSELSINAMGKGGDGSQSLFELFKGTVNAIVEKLTPGAKFEIKTNYAVAAVKGTQFEVSAEESESAVTVAEGTVAMSDPEGKRRQDVSPLQRCSASQGRLNPAFALGKREAGEFRARWERARMIHGQRKELIKAFEQHSHERKAALQARRALWRQRQKDREKHADKKDKKEILDRRKAARERFEKAREEIKKERKLRSKKIE